MRKSLGRVKSIGHKDGTDLGSIVDGKKEFTNTKSKFHVVVTAIDAAYNQWECMIMYYWYKKAKVVPGSGMLFW